MGRKRMEKRKRTKATAKALRQVGSDTLTVGLPEEWNLFKAKHVRFLAEFSRLKTALNLAYRVQLEDDPVGLTIFAMGRLIGEDFLEITLLAGNGYGIGCLKILRGMFERAVTLRYLHAHPECIDAFAHYDFIQRGRLANRIIETMKENLTDDQRAKLEAIAAEMEPYREEFTVKMCNKCGAKGLNFAWGRGIVEMAFDAPTMRPFVVPCYQRPLLYSHATAHGLSEHMKPVGEDGFAFDFAPRRRDASEAVMLGHQLLLDTLVVFNERFRVPGLQPALLEAISAFRDVWHGEQSRE